MQNQIEISDSDFDSQRIPFCRLLVQVGVQDFSYCILDTRPNKIVLLKSISGLESENDFSEIISDDEILNKEFDSKIVFVESNESTLVPEAFYDAQKKPELLQFNFTTTGNNVFADKLKNPDAYNVFAISDWQKDFMDSNFPHVAVHHTSTVLIESVMLRFRYKTEPVLVINIRRQHFDVVVIAGNQLQFYNSFKYQNSEDFIYYVLYMCEQLQFNPENLEANLCGIIDAHSPLYIMIHKYMRNVNFLSRTLNHSFSDEFADFAAHQFATLLDLNLCES